MVIVKMKRKKNEKYVCMHLFIFWWLLEVTRCGYHIGRGLGRLEFKSHTLSLCLEGA